MDGILQVLLGLDGIAAALHGLAFSGQCLAPLLGKLLVEEERLGVGEILLVVLAFLVGVVALFLGLLLVAQAQVLAAARHRHHGQVVGPYVGLQRVVGLAVLGLARCPLQIGRVAHRQFAHAVLLVGTDGIVIHQ